MNITALLKPLLQSALNDALPGIKTSLIAAITACTRTDRRISGAPETLEIVLGVVTDAINGWTPTL